MIIKERTVFQQNKEMEYLQMLLEPVKKLKELCSNIRKPLFGKSLRSNSIAIKENQRINYFRWRITERWRRATVETPPKDSWAYFDAGSLRKVSKQ